MTTVLGVLGVLVVLFGVAAVALRDEAVLVEAPPDRADLALPADGPVTAADLERVRFGMALRGYRMAQVDEVLDRLAGELLARDEQLAALNGELERLRVRPDAVAERAAVPAPAGQDGGMLLTHDEAPAADEGPDPAQEPPVEHVPDSGETDEPLPGVTTRPGADPPAPVPFPEPVHTDEPVHPPRQPDAAGPGTAVPASVPSAATPAGPRSVAAVRPAPARPAPARSPSRTAAVTAAGHALHLARRLRSRLADRLPR